MSCCQVILTGMKIKRYIPDLRIQMATCDANYIRMLKLLPTLTEGLERQIVVPGKTEGEDLLFTLVVTERFRYTSTILLTQDSPDSMLPWYRRPRMEVRIYHDANTAEVISYQNHRHFRAAGLLHNFLPYQPDEKQQLNLFLAEWLALCLDRGISDRNFLLGEPASPV